MAASITSTELDCCGQAMRVIRQHGARRAICQENGRHDGFICGSCGAIMEESRDYDGIYVDCEQCGNGGWLPGS